MIESKKYSMTEKFSPKNYLPLEWLSPNNELVSNQSDTPTKSKLNKFPNPNYAPAQWFTTEVENSKLPILDAADKISDKILIDALTGCYNLRYFQKFKKENSDPGRNHNKIGLVFIDINNLKTINDRFGHVAGDVLITETIKYLRSVFRQGDEIVRVGGDEFIIICHNQNNNEHFEANLLSKVKTVCSSPPRPISFAFGLAVFNKDDQSLHDTEKRADQIMYECKKEMKKNGIK